MDFVLATTVIATLFVVIGLAEPLAAKIDLPFSVILAALGALIGTGALFFLQTELTDALNPAAEAILGFPIIIPMLLLLVKMSKNNRKIFGTDGVKKSSKLKVRMKVGMANGIMKERIVLWVFTFIRLNI